ncbi:type VI secretion system-associated protein TagF [Luteimonas sp. FCS-9]|uniref:type VI secretion system-associated protein TagF n=1 Tax=Luteimonas sp. FCS-9 TaxID=1547516 RepID=UPI00063E74E7|nr:type VI secretion system-associated protein TagF [Luteimonas sp. FCS-9]KLJ02879.1 type VI secretion protein [Luteimonas sp. FCS-9]
MSQRIAVRASYFGKLPSRGDFVRSADNVQLMALLDRWAASSLESLSHDPDWKRLYDGAGELRYAFLGSRSRAVVGGLLLPSRDVSERRFPFLSAVRFDVSDPLGFLGRSPMALSRVWTGLVRCARDAVSADDAAGPLQALAELRLEVESDPGAHAGAFEDFLELQTLGSLQASLEDAGHGGLSLRQALPALGLLLQPILAGGNVTIDRGLELPLPRDPLYRPLVATFWLDIVAAFLARGDFELTLLVRESPLPVLLIGFDGADSRLLHAALDARVAGEYLIHLRDADWVEEQLATDYAFNRLASYLDRTDLALKTARGVFRETFLGA